MTRCKIGGTHSGCIPSGERKFEIQKIQDWHREVMRLIVLGWRTNELAAFFGVSRETISCIRNSSIVKRQVDIMQFVCDGKVMTPAAKMKEMFMDGLFILDGLMKADATPPALKTTIVFGVGDRSGHGPTKKIEGKHAVAVFDRPTLEELEKRKEDAIAEGITVKGIIVEAEEVV